MARTIGKFEHLDVTVHDAAIMHELQRSKHRLRNRQYRIFWQPLQTTTLLNHPSSQEERGNSHTGAGIDGKNAAVKG